MIFFSTANVFELMKIKTTYLIPMIPAVYFLQLLCALLSWCNSNSETITVVQITHSVACMLLFILTLATSCLSKSKLLTRMVLITLIPIAVRASAFLFPSDNFMLPYKPLVSAGVAMQTATGVVFPVFIYYLVKAAKRKWQFE